MSIKRHFTECGYGCSHGSYEHPEGIWVDFNDHQAEVARLKAEVERLTKLCQATSPDGFIHIRDINAAKEGKPSV